MKPHKENNMSRGQFKKGGDSISNEQVSSGDGRIVRILASSEPSMDTTAGSVLTASPSAPAFLSRSPAAPGTTPSSASPSPSRQLRPQSTPKKRNSASDLETGSSGKFERRRYDKEKKVTFDIGALFEAVEQQDLDLVKTILDSGSSMDINCLNRENLTPLDVAVMTNNIPMAKMLLAHGGRESPLFERGDCRHQRLGLLVQEAEKRVVDLTAIVLNGSSGNANISPAQQKENEKLLSHWEFRHRLLKRMKAGYDHARPPDPPTNVQLTVTSSSSLQVQFSEPLNHNGAVVTKYKVEWSCYEDFLPVAGEAVVEDLRFLQHCLTGLTKGTRYYVRVAAWNMKGYGQPAPSSPPFASPSSWRDVDGVECRLEGKVQRLQELFQQVRKSRPADSSGLKDKISKAGDSPQLQKKRISIKNLFISAPKFQKNLKRGIYLATLVYCEDRVLVTSEEQLPIVEVDENFAGTSILSDLYWMMKIACTWDDVKSLKQDLDKSSSAGTLHFRSKMLQAVTNMQNSLGMHDLGQFYHKPLRDSNGSTVIITINHVTETKFVALGSGKWVSVGKLARRQSLQGLDTADAQGLLIHTIPEMIMYHSVSSIKLPQGLYVGFLKLHCSVENIRVLVPHKMPNVLPHVKVRDCPNVSREEWEWLQSLGGDNQHKPTATQVEFQQKIAQASRRLFSLLDISPEAGGDYRLYDMEVIELGPTISFLLLLPSVEDVCIVPGQSDSLVERKEFSLLPVQVFEMIHMSTYQPDFIHRYARLSSIMEMDLSLAQQSQRQAFSTEEITEARERVDAMLQIQQTLDRVWKGVRWIMDITTYARDKNTRGGIPVTALFSGVDSSDLDPAGRSRIPDNNNSTSSQIVTDSNEISVGKDNRRIAKFYDPNDDPSPASSPVEDSPAPTPISQSHGIIRVYAAYETGLSKNVSVKLHVTNRTTAREVINLVVRQLNKARAQRCNEGALYREDQLPDFCLVAVIGARERILRDDYPLLQLQNPWKQGRLYVRLSSQLLAALHHGQATAV